MATILYFGKYGSAHPTEATFPFHMAVGALEAGHQPQIVLAGEATNLMKDEILQHIQGVGVPKLKDLLDKLVAQGVAIGV